MSRLFVTGTGTGVGKTLLTCLLLRRLRAEGHRVRALKPVVSGFDADAVAGSDTGLILAAMDDSEDAAAIGAVSPWRFAAPLSPDMAAAREGRRLDVGEVAAFCRYAAPGEDEGVLLVEGVGGAMTPLSGHETVLDWMAALSWPVLLVAGSYLGALSHTLSAAEAIRLRGLTLAAVVVCETADSPVPLSETASVLGRFLAPIPVRALPRLDRPSRDGREVSEIVDLLELSV